MPILPRLPVSRPQKHHGANLSCQCLRNYLLRNTHRALTWAQHNKDDPCKSSRPTQICQRLGTHAYTGADLQSCYPVATKAFECTVTGPEGKALSEQGIIVETQIPYKEAHERLNDFDVMIVVGGNSDAILKGKLEPLPLIKAYSELQKKDSARERTLLSVCTGSLFLAEAGILSGLSATTHPDYMTAFENLCSHSAVRDAQERTDVDEEARYVVNNLRFDIGDEDENPYVRRKADIAQSQDGRRPSNARYVQYLRSLPAPLAPAVSGVTWC